VVILEELALPYELHSMEPTELKKKPFTNINPNGRSPAIEDPNTGITLWESGAIIQYLIEQYDKDNKLSYNDLKQRHLLNQYLMFQVSGQGPYYGQAAWFSFLHAEKLPSAIKRYQDEIRRIMSVLEVILNSNGTGWLVGDKCTYADLAFVPYHEIVQWFLGVDDSQKFEGYPTVAAWHERMRTRPSWQTCVEKRVQLLDKFGLQPNGFPKEDLDQEEFLRKLRTGE
jgi:glutathione S-transferase